MLPIAYLSIIISTVIDSVDAAEYAAFIAAQAATLKDLGYRSTRFYSNHLR